MSFYAVHGSDRTVSYVEAPEPAVAATTVIKWNNDQPSPEGYESMFVVRVVEVGFEAETTEGPIKDWQGTVSPMANPYRSS
jgi:hypothetical protein